MAILAELLQQHVQTLAFRHEHGRPQHLADVEFTAHRVGADTQQVLGEQNSDDCVAILADHREARMPGLEDHRQNVVHGVRAMQDRHLRTRHHDVPDLELGDADHAFKHLQRVRVQQAAPLGVAHLLEQFLTVLRFAGQLVEQSAKPAAPHLACPVIGHRTYSSS